MDLVSLAFLSLIVVLGGFVAYWGDLIGRRIGKKRHTIGRLRPRHTAALITGIAGGLATLLAILVLIGVSEPVRVWVLEGNAAREKLRAVQQTLERTQKEIRSKDAKLAETDQKLERTAGQLGQTSQRLEDARTSLQDARSRSQQLEQQSSSLSGQVSKFSQELRSASTDLKTTRKRVEELRDRARSLETSNETYSVEYNRLSQDSLKLRIEIDGLEKSIGTLMKTSEELAATKRQLEADLANQAQAARSEIAEYERQKDQLNGELSNARRDLATLKNLFDATSTVPRLQPPIVLRGAEISRLPIGSSLTRAEAAEALESLLMRASQAARDKGAIPRSGARYAEIVEITDAAGHPISVERQKSMLVAAMSAQRHPAVLIATSILNAFLGEPVPLTITIAPNPVVYKQGETVAEARIAGGRPLHEILVDISSFAREKLAPEAMKDGLLPVQGSPEPLGEIPLSELLGLAEQIQSVNRTLRVQFVAAQETRAADRLKLQFRLR
ncbi:MAG: DUF3084 domain-containing protein [Fimbriimonadaceae bacterium]|nr:DUF3084 domain-containing protein [Fimbriimonadaceae bacterium]QYK56237.1 MAG: DUF3084 domain-containing protein [Fimbriimonadaceae bacterium]